MLNHPDLMISVTKQHVDDLLHEAEHRHLLNLARAWRKACRAEHLDRTDADPKSGPRAGAVPVTPSSLAACGPRLAR
jgi:hypothetical protein